MDSEILAGKLKKKGFRIVYENTPNSVAIVNTCGFIEDAKTESVDILLELANLKKEAKIARLIVTGCLSQRYSREIMRKIEEIDGIFGTSTFTKIPDYLDRILKGQKINLVDKKTDFLYDHRTPRLLMTPAHTSYIKIQEGCMNMCSYCVIPRIRGRYRSRKMESVLKEAALLKKRGAKEINLIGQDTTSYGMDMYKKPSLADLLRKIAKVMKSGWVRLLYTHPAHYTSELVRVIKDEDAICKYLDLPIQHINDKILKKMNRRVTKKDIVTLINSLRMEIPDVAIRTSIIVGFPGETDKDFAELENFVKEVRFERLGVFIYSREENTPAYGFSGQVPQEEKDARFDRIMEAQKKISFENNKNLIGKTLKVLIDDEDQSQDGQYIGRTQHDAPEVDGTVYVKSAKTLKKGDFVDAVIKDVLEYDLLGET